MKNFVIKDKKGRELVKIDSKQRMAIARYPDLDEVTKKYIVSMYLELTGKKDSKLIDFLNYKTKQNEFCS